MTCSKEGTDEGREQEKVSTEKKKKPGAGLYLLPLAAALPVIAAAALVIHRFGPRIHKLLSILIKLVVRA